MSRKPASIGWTCYYFTFILLITLVLIKQASQLPIDDDMDKRTSGHNIMRFGRQAGHNILRFGRTPGHNIMRFGKREESNSAPGSSFEVSESKQLAADYPSGRYSLMADLPSSSSNYGTDPQYNLYGYYGQASPLNALFYNQRGQAVLPYQQAKKGRPETDHVIMRFG